MRHLLSLCITLALVVSLGQGAQADPYADSVAGSTGVSAQPCCDDPNDALGAPDASGAGLGNFTGFVTLEDTGTLDLDFDNNVCFESGDAAADIIVDEYLDADETFTVAVGQQGGTLSGTVNGESDVAESLDLSGVTSDPFNTVRITSTSDGGVAPGADIDAVTCVSTLDQADIVKDFADNTVHGSTGEIDDIDVGLGTIQYEAFTIEITNNTGNDGGLSDLTFLDVVPGEFDLDGDPISDNADCTVTTSNPPGATAHGKAKSKLEPEFIMIDAGGLDDEESCTITVNVVTDTKSFPKGNSPDYTPTSCAADPGTITLNDGVRVIHDATGHTIFEDDDTLALACTSFTD